VGNVDKGLARFGCRIAGGAGVFGILEGGPLAKLFAFRRFLRGGDGCWLFGLGFCSFGGRRCIRHHVDGRACRGRWYGRQGLRQGKAAEKKGWNQKQNTHCNLVVIENCGHSDFMNFQELANHYPTPFFAYDAGIIKARVQALVSAFATQRVSLHYAIKANDNRHVLQLAADAGIGACLVSRGEFERARAGGIGPAQMLMNGVGKSRDEITFVLQNQIGQLNVESLPELPVIADIAKQLGIRATICLRINPEVVAKAHSHTITARRTDKFGLLVEDLPEARAIIASHPELDWRGFSCHIGSQVHGVEELAESYRVMADLFRTERKTQLHFDRLDLGGGFGVSYTGENYAQPADYAPVILEITKDLQESGVTIQLEPGRYIAAEAGTLVTQALYVKDSGQGDARTRFVVVDAAMNNLIRPALYGAYHPITLARDSAAGSVPATIVGPVCESGDVFAVARDLPADVKAGDIVKIGFAGAYGMAMSSQYNARDRLAEVLVDGDSHKLIRRAFSAREYDDLTLID